MRKLLDVDTEHLSTMFSDIAIHHRMARSLDFLGSALKVVAGTPHAADLAQLVESSNRQVVMKPESDKRPGKHFNQILKSSKKF